MIYFIYDDKNDAIKIGVTNDIEKRLLSLQCGNPTRLQIKHTIEGSYKEESILHYHYRENRLLGEWFTYTDQLQKDIYDNNLESIISDYEAVEVVVKPKPMKNKKQKIEYKVKKRKRYETEEERIKARKERQKKYDQKIIEQNIIKAYDKLEEHFIKSENGKISTKELSDYLLKNNIKSKYGEKNLPVKHVTEYFNVKMKKIMINKQRQMYVVGLDFAQKEN